jgi:hypothetical protein
MSMKTAQYPTDFCTLFFGIIGKVRKFRTKSWIHASCTPDHRMVGRFADSISYETVRRVKKK